MKSLYLNLAKDGIRRHKRLYYPFIGTTVFFIVLINLCLCIKADSIIKNSFGSTTIISTMKLGTIILSIFALISISQNFNFIQKNKADESGLYLILGMEKEHLIKLYFYELGIVFLRSAIIGTLVSLIVYKISLAGFLKLMHTDTNVLDSGVFPMIKPLLITILIFLVIFIILLIHQIIKSKNFTPLNFMQEARAGQKAPKFPFLNGILGILCIGIGYYISLSTDNPLKALKLFFIAVILVIIGTYLAFSVIVSGVLKLLQKNKKFYYKKSNFTAVSGLIYRVRNSATTLASIAILSTMVIVVLTSGFSLYFGIMELQEKLYPYDYIIEFREQNKSLDILENEVVDAIKSEGKTADTIAFRKNYLPIDIERTEIKKLDKEPSWEELFVTNGINIYWDNNQSYIFNDVDAILITNDKDFNITKIGDTELKVKKENEENLNNRYPLEDSMMFDVAKLIFKDEKTYEKVQDYLKLSDDGEYDESLLVAFNVDQAYDSEFGKRLMDDISNISNKGTYGFVDSKATVNENLAVFAGIFFVGIILGFGFLVSTVLAIYYKQLSEGLDDRSRFKTMRQLGMTDREARKSISKQMGLVFFLPLIFAFTHSFFALPIITQFLKLLGLAKEGLFIKCLLMVFAAYILFYLVTFKLTEKTYNHIVLEKE
jgi:hypothetical protein